MVELFHVFLGLREIGQYLFFKKKNRFLTKQSIQKKSYNPTRFKLLNLNQTWQNPLAVTLNDSSGNGSSVVSTALLCPPVSLLCAIYPCSSERKIWDAGCRTHGFLGWYPVLSSRFSTHRTLLVNTKRCCVTPACLSPFQRWNANETKRHCRVWLIQHWDEGGKSNNISIFHMWQLLNWSQ